MPMEALAMIVHGDVARPEPSEVWKDPETWPAWTDNWFWVARPDADRSTRPPLQPGDFEGTMTWPDVPAKEKAQETRPTSPGPIDGVRRRFPRVDSRLKALRRRTLSHA